MPTIALPKVWNPGDVPAVTDVNADFAALLNAINGGLDVANLTGTPNLPASFTVGTAAVLTPAAPQVLTPESFFGQICNTGGPGNQPGGFNTVETVVAGGIKTGAIAPSQSCIIPANTLSLARMIKITLMGICLSSSGNTVTLRIRIGANGTVADTSVCSWALTAGTTGSGGLFTCVLYLIPSAVGASASFSTGNCPSMLQLVQSGASLNIASTTNVVLQATNVATFNSTIANYLSLTLQASANTTNFSDLFATVEFP